MYSYVNLAVMPILSILRFVASLISRLAGRQAGRKAGRKPGRQADICTERVQKDKVQKDRCTNIHVPYIFVQTYI